MRRPSGDHDGFEPLRQLSRAGPPVAGTTQTPFGHARV